jgi:pimeloyl-ACP methyl ester carboxylesterase
MSTDHFESLDEFATLPADAAESGLPWRGAPAVTRLTTVSAGGPVSSVRWGTGPPELVLLHGAARNAHTWDVFALAVDRPLLALDLPGHGESAWRDDGQYGPDDIAPAVAEVIGRRASTPVTVVGQSLGGLTAIALAALRPDLVAGIVLVDALPSSGHADQVWSWPAGPEVFSSRAQIVARAQASGVGRSDASAIRGVWHNTRMRADGSVVWKHHLGNFSGNRPPMPSDTSSLWPRLEAFTGPVLVVRGERGSLSDSAVAELRARIPDVRIHDVPTGHNVQEDDPVLLSGIVDRFLASGPVRAEGGGATGGAGGARTHDRRIMSPLL